MSLTPDYFISGTGYPVLNREKFKFSTPAPPVGTVKFRRNSLVGLHNKNLRCHTCDNNNDKKKLLKKRSRNHVIGSNRDIVIGPSAATTVQKWSNDKEHKCYINQQIKEMESSQSSDRSQYSTSSSRQQLDNRLVDEARYLNGILARDNETEVLVLQQLDF